MGGPGGFLRHCSGGGQGPCSSPAVLGWVGCGRRESLFSIGTKRPGEEEVLSRVELLPGARFRIPVQNQAGAWGSGLVGEILRVPWPSGWSTVCLGPGPWDFSPGTAGALIPVA